MTAVQDAERWQRVAKAVRARRESLGLRREDMTASASTVFKLETAAQKSYKSFALRRVETDLGWPAGTIDVIAEGGDPPDVASRSELDALRAEVAELRRLVERLGTPPDERR